MADEPSYQVYPTATVKRQIQEVFLHLQELGLSQTFNETLQMAAVNLRSDPMAFGDPRFRLKLPGGVVYHRLINGLSLHYAVYEANYVVYLYDVKYIGGGG